MYNYLKILGSGRYEEAHNTPKYRCASCLNLSECFFYWKFLDSNLGT